MKRDVVAPIRLPRNFSPGMVLQQNCEAYLRGSAKGAKYIYLSLERLPNKGRQIQGRKYGTIYRTRAEVSASGHFQLKLPAVKATPDNYQLTINTDRQTIVLKNITFGEVWLFAGHRYFTELPVDELIDACSKNSMLRFFTMNRSGLADNEFVYSEEEMTRIPGGRWINQKISDLNELNPAALAFGLELQKKLHCPVAVYDLVTESFLHSWLPPQILATERDLQEVVRRRGFNQGNKPSADEKNEQSKTTVTNQDLMDDTDADSKEKTTVAPIDFPSTLYRHKLSCYRDLALRGVIWQSCDADVYYPQFVSKGLREFNKSLRSLFIAPSDNLHFIFNQLPLDYYCEDGKQNRDETLVKFNEMLTMTRRKLCLSAGMVTTYDLWREDYPQVQLDLQELGRRFQIVATGKVYNHKQINSAPECVYAEKTGNKLLLTFDNVGKGLSLPDGDNCLKGFMLRGKNTDYLPANAKILYGVRVLVWSDEIDDPVACAYAYSSFNQHCNLSARELMPVVPFSLEAIKKTLNYPAWLDCDSMWQLQVKTPGDSLVLDPLWLVYQGKAKFSLDRHNKCHGNASLRLNYQQSTTGVLEIGPQLGSASCYAPLDLSHFNYLSLNVFNRDSHLKSIALVLQDAEGERIQYANAVIRNDLAWHEVSFDLQRAEDHGLKLSKIQHIGLMIIDDHPKGCIYIDKISFQEPKNEENR